MVSCFVTMCLAAAMGQAPPPASAQAAWLKSVPADAAAVVRVKALETGRDDLLKMVEAMSGNAAALLKPQLEQGLAMFSAQYGQPAAQHPFFTVVRLPKDGSPVPPWAVIVEGDYQGVLKAVSKKDDLKPKSLGGYDSFDGPDGQTWFAAKGAGFAAFGQDEELIKAIAKPSAALSEKITPDLAASFLGGDLGVYVNIASIQGQYGEQIDAGKQMAMGMIDQAGAQMNDTMKEGAKAIYGALFDAVKTGDALTFNLDFAAEGLGVSGLATVKADSASARSLASARAGSGEKLGQLPAAGTVFAYANVNPESAAGLLKFATSMVTGQGKPSPEMEKALAAQREAGASESYSVSTGGGANGIGAENVTLSYPKDPARAVEAMALLSQATKAPGGMVKDVKVTPKAQAYKGYVLTEAKSTFDLDKMVTPNAPGGVEGLRKALGGDSVTVYFGTDGKSVLSVTAKTFDRAKALIDSATSGQDGIGKAPGFAALRKKLPEKVGALFLVNAQAMVRQMAAQLSTVTGKGDIQVPGDMPKETALLGGSLTSSPKGFAFQFVVPSAVGPVIEKGLVPVLQSMQGLNQ